MQDGTLLAAVDLGSNSFRLEIGRFEHGHIQRVEYLKETVRQGGGLDEERNLSLEAMQRGWACLARFGEGHEVGFPVAGDAPLQNELGPLADGYSALDEVVSRSIPPAAAAASPPAGRTPRRHVP